MAKQKIIRKKEIEPVTTSQNSLFLYWERVQTFVQNNMRQITAIGLVIFVLVGGLGIWWYYEIKAEGRASALLYSAVKLYNSANVNNTSGSEPVLSDSDAYNQALAKFKDTYNQYPDKKAGIKALFYAGSCNFNLGNYKEAISYYHDFLDKIGNEENLLKPFTYEGLGYAYEEEGDYQKAIEWFEKQKNEKSAALNMMSLLNLARCYQAVGENEKSCQAYREFGNAHPSSSFVEIANIKLADLCNDSKE
jgi:tetratricopeptide (TPR) repeat protein